MLFVPLIKRHCFKDNNEIKNTLTKLAVRSSGIIPL